MAQLTDDAARELNLRVISPDRPGIRHSTFHANRKLLDWPPLIAEVADNLGIAHFRMLAVSGGAPYALATAWAMPQRVRAISIVSGAPPIADLADRGGLFPLYRWMLFFYRKHPEVLRRSFQLARPFLSVRMPLRLRPLLLKLLQPCDADVLRDSAAFEIFFESQRQAWRGSARGVMADAQIHAEPWGFSLEEIRVPVRLWHGKADRSFSFLLAKQVASRLPNCRAYFVENEGHYSLPIRHVREILADLKSA
jgi:pimeloyl-ACP methyl ester carboxylesterase